MFFTNCKGGLLKKNNFFLKGRSVLKGSEINNNIGSVIRNLCKEKNITVQELEHKCSLGNGSVKRWEDGAMPKVSALIPVCDFFNISLDYLTARTPNRDTFEEWNRKYNVKRLADEAKFFDSLGKLKGMFSDIGVVDLTDTDIELLKQYVKILKQK